MHSRCASRRCDVRPPARRTVASLKAEKLRPSGERRIFPQSLEGRVGALRSCAWSLVERVRGPRTDWRRHGDGWGHGHNLVRGANQVAIWPSEKIAESRCWLTARDLDSVQQ